MGKKLNNFIIIIFFTFGLMSLINTYRWDNFNYGLISLLLGGVSLLISIGALYYAFKKGYFDE